MRTSEEVAKKRHARSKCYLNLASWLWRRSSAAFIYRISIRVLSYMCVCVRISAGPNRVAKGEVEDKAVEVGEGGGGGQCKGDKRVFLEAAQLLGFQSQAIAPAAITGWRSRQGSRGKQWPSRAYVCFRRKNLLRRKAEAAAARLRSTQAAVWVETAS